MIPEHSLEEQPRLLPRSSEREDPHLPFAMELDGDFLPTSSGSLQHSTEAASSTSPPFHERTAAVGRMTS